MVNDLREHGFRAGVAVVGGLLALTLAGCGGEDDAPAAHDSTVTGDKRTDIPHQSSEYNPQKNPYFGDLHVHTMYSFDAFAYGTRTNPDDAYRFAKGAAISHGLGYDVQLREPLDFYGVTDHAMFLGIYPAMADRSSSIGLLPESRAIAKARTLPEQVSAFQSIRGFIAAGYDASIWDADISKRAWQDTVDAAERHNDPGRFTTFVGYEYTSGPQQQNLHRNVIFRTKAAPELPFSRIDSPNPEDLWKWMDGLRQRGIDSLAIPHNSNGSNGQMFALRQFDGSALDAQYAELRKRNEPLVEMTQVKGTSDTHPLLSPNDEWADFEIMPYRIATQIQSDVPGSYVREAYGNGLVLDRTEGFNPFEFGLIGASDTHNSATTDDEAKFFGKIGSADGAAARRGAVKLPAPDADGNEYANPTARFWSASGLAGVWAEENTRFALFDAMRRKETFATSGPRIPVRFFAGWSLSEDLVRADDAVEQAYAAGVPMGGELAGRDDNDDPLSFFVWAQRDALSAPLQRLQVIKVWLEKGVKQEQVFDVACSDGGTADPATHRCPDNGASVDLATCEFSKGSGAAELKTVWTDPAFNADQRAMYYVRVLENPTCRWSSWDALRAGEAPRPDLQATIQERAWSSPIWYHPPSPAG